jgi:hypothetical protein
MLSYRKVVIKIFWDGNEHPSVLAPLGDFFCVGQSIPANFQSLPFTVSVTPADNLKYGGTSALNCYLTMPFNKRARVEIENQGENAYVQVCDSMRNGSGIDPSTSTSTMSCMQLLTARMSCTSTQCGSVPTRRTVGRQAI